MTTTRAPPSGVYVHVPWCRRRCPYCDFYFVVGKRDPGFAAAVVEELAARHDEIPGPVASVAFGGGTPSVLAAADVGAILDGVVREKGIAAGAEVTLEANPEDLDDDALRALVDAGVERVSLGVQSFDDDVLRALGRKHDGARARAVVEAALRIVPRVSVDLIIGVPDEPPARLARDLATVVALGPGHVSTYLLTLEPGTTLARLVEGARRPPVDDDAQASAYRRVQDELPAHGLQQYEISSFARPGHESRHNRIYWGQGTYLGLGPGAHSMRILDDGGVARRHNLPDLAAWRARPSAPPSETEVLTPAHALREAIAFGLRDVGRGVSLGALVARHRAALPLDVPRTLAAFAARGMVVLDDDRARITAEGAAFADAIARELLVP